MAEVAIEMVDINAVLNSTPVFAQAVRLEAANRRINELEAEILEAPACDCQVEETIE